MSVDNKITLHSCQWLITGYRSTSTSCFVTLLTTCTTHIW